MLLIFVIFTTVFALVTSQVVQAGKSDVIRVVPVKSTNATAMSSPAVLTKDCTSPMVVGPCEALIPRYFYNTVTNQCQFFTYGGCAGNGNNYRTKQLCEDACMA